MCEKLLNMQAQDLKMMTRVILQFCDHFGVWCGRSPLWGSGPKHFILQEGVSEQEAKLWPFKMTESLEVMVPNIKQNKIKPLILSINSC